MFCKACGRALDGTQKCPGCGKTARLSSDNVSELITRIMRGEMDTKESVNDTPYIRGGSDPVPSKEKYYVGRCAALDNRNRTLEKSLKTLRTITAVALIIVALTTASVIKMKSENESLANRLNIMIESYNEIESKYNRDAGEPAESETTVRDEYDEGYLSPSEKSFDLYREIMPDNRRFFRCPIK